MIESWAVSVPVCLQMCFLQRCYIILEWKQFLSALELCFSVHKDVISIGRGTGMYTCMVVSLWDTLQTILSRSVYHDLVLSCVCVSWTVFSVKVLYHTWGKNDRKGARDISLLRFLSKQCCLDQYVSHDLVCRAIFFMCMNSVSFEVYESAVTHCGTLLKQYCPDQCTLQECCLDQCT